MCLRFFVWNKNYYDGTWCQNQLHFIIYDWRDVLQKNYSMCTYRKQVYYLLVGKKNTLSIVLICIINNQQFILFIHKTMHLDNHCNKTCNDMLNSTRYTLCNVVVMHKHKMNRKGKKFPKLLYLHKKKSCPFPLPKFISFLVKWDKID
jgi:ABC-type Mn2+/Zn2+ transport system ATPase subunit